MHILLLSGLFGSWHNLGSGSVRSCWVPGSFPSLDVIVNNADSTNTADIVTVVVDVGRHVYGALRHVDRYVVKVRVLYQLKFTHVQPLGVRIRTLSPHIRTRRLFFYQ